jgi:tRNA-2-methylthio-N6-dimethylallyladenosine synthase
MNSAESAALALACRERGWLEAADGESADLVLLNTCSVRLTAEKRVLGRIAHYAAVKKKSGRSLCIVIAGCMAQRLGEKLKEKFPQVDYVMGTSSRSLFPLILESVEKADFQSPFDALDAGIGMVHQEFSLIPGFTAAENILLNREELNKSAL